MSSAAEVWVEDEFATVRFGDERLVSAKESAYCQAAKER